MAIGHSLHQGGHQSISVHRRPPLTRKIDRKPPGPRRPKPVATFLLAVSWVKDVGEQTRVFFGYSWLCCRGYLGIINLLGDVEDLLAGPGGRHAAPDLPEDGLALGHAEVADSRDKREEEGGEELRVQATSHEIREISS